MARKWKDRGKNDIGKNEKLPPRPAANIGKD